MRIKLLSMVTLVTLLASPVANYAQAPTLGSAANFVLFTSVGAVGNTGPSYLTGNVGSNNGSSTGFGNVNGIMANNNGTTAAAAADLLTAYNQINSTTPGFFPSSLLGNGDTLEAGVYHITGTSSLSNTLTLDGEGDPNAIFIFQLDGAFSTSSNSTIKLINGAVACNVFWKVEGLVSMAAGTKMKGTVIANNAAITMNAGVQLEGRALSTSGAISINSVKAATPIGCGSPTLTGPSKPGLGAASCFAIFSGNGPVSNSGSTYATGDIGTNVGLTTGYNPLFVTGIIHPIPDGATNSAASSLLSTYSTLNTMGYDIELLYPAQFGNKLTLTPHVYRMNGAVTFADTLFLNAAGTSSAVFVIQVNGAFSASANAKVVLLNGALAENVFWKIEGAVGFLSNVTFKGNIIANNGAVSLATGALLDGRALTTNGALSTSAVTVNIPGPGSGVSIAATSSTLCPGFSTTLTASGASFYLWSNNSTSNTIIVTPGSTTGYSVTGTSSVSGCGNTSSKTITVMPSPTIVASSGSICAGSTYTIVTSGASTYSFSSGNGTVTPTSTTNYSVSGTSTAGCISSAVAVSTVIVHARPIITVNSGAVCNGSTFTMVPGGASTYTFSNGSSTVIPTSNSTYSVIGTSSAGCVAISSVVSSVVVNPLPVISVNSGTVCLGSTFTMVPSGASTYSYSSGSATVAPAINSVYNVMGTSALGCVSAAPAVSSVSVVATPVVAVNSGVICSGMVFTMTPTGAATYTFSNGSATVSPLVNTSYSVTGTGPTGCLSYNTAVSNVVVNALPVVSVNSGSVCAGKSFTMIPAGAISYTFANGSNVVTPSSTSTYSVMGTNANGCVSASPAISSVMVVALPVVSVNSGSVCAGQSFTMVPTGATTYTFMNGSNVVTPSATSNYSVAGTNTAGCISAAMAVSTVTVHALPVVSVNSGAVCAGDSFTMVPTGASTYTFANGSNVVTPTSTGSYSVSGTSTAGCTSATQAVSTVTVNALPVLVVTTTSTMMCVGETVVLRVTGGATYSWDNALTTSTIAVSPTTTTVYTVTGMSTEGCSSTMTISQKVDLCNGIVNITGTTSDLNIYPNPNNGVFTIEVIAPVKMIILNNIGQVVYQQMLTSGVNQIGHNELANGIYFVNVGKQSTKMIISGK